MAKWFQLVFLHVPITKALLGSTNSNAVQAIYLLDYKKNIRFDFDDELKIGDVRYDDMT